MDSKEKLNWLETTEQVVLENLSRPFTKQSKIAGVDVDELDKSKILSAMKIVEQIHSIKHKLAKKGIPPIAVLPEKIVSELIKPLPFYIFGKINENGEVKADLMNYALRESKKMILPFIFYSILFYVGLWIVGSSCPPGQLKIILRICFWFWIIILLFRLLFSLEDPRDCFFSWKEFWNKQYDDEGYPKEKGEEMDPGFIMLFSWPNILICWLNYYLTPLFFTSKMEKHFLFPNKVDKGNETIKVKLPPAPREVQETLIKLHEMGIYCYPIVHERAFKISIDKKELKLLRDGDPLIVSDCGRFLVVHCSYGKIPEEEKLIERVKRAASQVTEEFLNSLN